MTRARSGLAFLLFALAACGRPFGVHDVTHTPVLDGHTPPVLDVRAQGGGLRIHVEYEAEEARRRWSVREPSDGVLEIHAKGRVKQPPRWLECAIPIARDGAEITIGDLDAGEYDVHLIVDGMPMISRNVVVPAGVTFPREARRTHRLGARGC